MFAFVRKSMAEEEFIVARLHAKLSTIDVDVREGCNFRFTHFHIHQSVKMVMCPCTFLIFVRVLILVLVSGLEELSLVAKQLLCEALIWLDKPALATDVLRRLWQS